MKTDASTEEPVISYGRIWKTLFSARKEILVSIVALAVIATISGALMEKEYVAEGTVKQTDLTEILQPPDGLTGALGLLAAANGANDRINSYITTLTSPEIAEELLKYPEYIDILFGDDWERVGNSAVWKHRRSVGWALRNGLCSLFSIECVNHLTPLRVSEELTSRVTIEPSTTITQGVLTNIGNTDTFDVSIRGKNPQALLKLLNFIHEAANKRIQHVQTKLTETIAKNLDARIHQLDNTEVRQQIISLLSNQEERLAVLRAGQFNYAAAWLVRPTVSSWPVRPNMALLYVLAFVSAFIAGPAWVWARNYIKRNRNEKTAGNGTAAKLVR